jgi:hypothetical protein
MGGWYPYCCWGLSTRQHRLENHDDLQLTEHHSLVADSPGASHSFAVEAASRSLEGLDYTAVPDTHRKTWWSRVKQDEKLRKVKGVSKAGGCVGYRPWMCRLGRGVRSCIASAADGRGWKFCAGQRRGRGGIGCRAER